MKVILYLSFAISIIGCSVAESEAVENNYSPVSTDVAQTTLKALSEKAMADLKKIPFDSLQIPRTVESDKQMKGTKSKSWTSGFYPGMLWQLYDVSRNEALKNAAIKWSAFVEKENLDDGTHDLGFKIYCPFGNAYRITKEEKYKDVFLTAAQTLSTRYNPNVGAIRSWDHHEHLWKFPVIIDNMMNLEMLFEATRLTGDSSYHRIADQHALTTLKHHFRKDHSSYHVVDYNPVTGEVVKKNTHQGQHHESAWSRGQAWGLYGYTVAYRYTGYQEYLEQARRIADFIFTHPNLPEDLIPYWDYDAPNIPNEPRDVSAATIAASGLFELSTHDPDRAEEYLSWANQILRSLDSEKYKCDVPPFFLKHSVGSIPGKFEMDAPIIYADYFYVEALRRKEKMNI